MKLGRQTSHLIIVSLTQTQNELFDDPKALAHRPETHVVVVQSTVPSTDRELDFEVSTDLLPDAPDVHPPKTPPEPVPSYLDLIENRDRQTVSRRGDAYAHLQPVKLSGPVLWPLFLALFEKSGGDISKNELDHLPGSTEAAARRVLKKRLSELLLPLDITIPAGEWKLVEVPWRNTKLTPAQ